jgi:molybdopterin molybdotransferase
MKEFIGFEEAFRLTLSQIHPLAPEVSPLFHLTGRILAADVFSKVDSPSADTSLKDGYAVIPEEVEETDAWHPVRLRLKGTTGAGDHRKKVILPGHAIRVTTGAQLPEGAGAVLSEEFCRLEGEDLVCFKNVRSGQNVLKRGSDIRTGDHLARKGEQVSPSLVGLLASAGLEGASVYKRPHVAVIGTGDEIVSPGRPLSPGKLYASNVAEICAWLSQFGIPHGVGLAGDRKEEIVSAIQDQLPSADAFVTSGGIWGSERDLMLQVLESLRWEGCYHRVRMGPGKAVTFGSLEGKPFFCLPGGPPSNEMAFLQIALPGILALGGHGHSPFPVISATLTEDVKGERSWTQFLHAHLRRKGEEIHVLPQRLKSRLQSMARKEALIVIPEGCEGLAQSQRIEVQALVPLVQSFEIFMKSGKEGGNRI